jgi:hypothetical protein
MIQIQVVQKIRLLLTWSVASQHISPPGNQEEKEWRWVAFSAFP